MKEAEHHKWQHYLMLALIVTIFGLMIYQVVMQERKVDQYYMSFVFTPLNADTTITPTFPTGLTGTFNGGIKEVRNALVDRVNDDALINVSVPKWSDWKVNAVPSFDPTDGSNTNMAYHYTFPVPASVLNDTKIALELVLEDATDRDGFFAGDADRLAWAQATFDPDINVSLTYGTYGTGSAGLAAH